MANPNQFLQVLESKPNVREVVGSGSYSISVEKPQNHPISDTKSSHFSYTGAVKRDKEVDKGDRFVLKDKGDRFIFVGQLSRILKK